LHAHKKLDKFNAKIDERIKIVEQNFKEETIRLVQAKEFEIVKLHKEITRLKTTTTVGDDDLLKKMKI